MEPPVSVLIPFRNAASTLMEALQSIQSQSFTQFEVVAIDDGSEDRSPQILQEVAERDGRMRLVQPGRIGLVAALNLGLSLCRAPFVARMDADDIMHPQRLQLQYEFMLANPDVSLVATMVEMFPPERVTEGYREYLRWQDSCLTPQEIRAEIYVEAPFVHPTVMFRKDRVVQIGGYRDGPFPEDYELWLRMCQAGCKMAKIPKRLLLWRDHPERLTRVDPRYSSEAFEEVRARYLSLDPRVRGPRDVVIWGAGRRTRQRAKLLMGLGVRPKAWVDVDFKKIGKRIWGLEVKPPSWLARKEKPFVLVYVRTHGAREEIWKSLNSMGYAKGDDFLFVG
jgi:glycosyltransferase involved in cell wall biosynthesis